MTQPFKQSVTFTLNKAHFLECFEQSAPPVNLKDYAKAAMLGVLGVALLSVEAEQYYVPLFLIGLAILEVFSIVYRRTWWVWRQLMGKTANGKVTLTIDEEGITTTSDLINSQILWHDVLRIEQTEKGLLVRHNKDVNYLSNAHLTEEIIGFILKHNPDS